MKDPITQIYLKSKKWYHIFTKTIIKTNLKKENEEICLKRIKLKTLHSVRYLIKIWLISNCFEYLFINETKRFIYNKRFNK